MSRVVVGLTNGAGLEDTLMSLAIQTHKPDTVYVAVPKTERKETVKEVAKTIKKILPGVGKVAIVEGDHGQLAGVMAPMLNGEENVVIVETGQRYDERLVENLVKGAERHPGCAICMDGVIIGKFPHFLAMRSKKDEPVDVISCKSGVLLPRIENLEPEIDGDLKIYQDFFMSTWLDREKIKKIAIASGSRVGPVSYTREYLKGIRAFRSRGFLCDNTNVKWFRSTVTLAAVASVVTIAVGVAVIVYYYHRHNQK